MSNLNVPLLRKIQEQILNEPKSFMMNRWFTYGPPGTLHVDDDFSGHCPYVEFTSCGTAACISGWACTLQFGTGLARVLTSDDFIIQGEKILGLPKDHGLFSVSYWDPDLRDAYMLATQNKSYECRAKIACEMIDRIIDRYGPKEGEEVCK